LKKALKLAKHQSSVETVEYVDRVITKLLENTRKARITVSEILKDTQGLNKKVVADSLVRLGWTKQTYKNGAVFYLKP
jgi:TATA-binding protein-associated factor Taf7